MSRKIAFTSLGCDKNRVDSEVMLGILQQNGYTAVADAAEADIIVVNTCCFIKDALEESIETILEMSKYKNPEVGHCKGLIVAGCLGQRYEKEFFDELPEVDAIVGTTAYESIAEVADEILGGKEQVKQLESIDLAMQDGNGKLRVLSTAPYFAYLKISEGCDNRCTYCVIPQMRGRHRSRELESLVEEATLLAQQGVKELVIVAQDTSIYGRDLYGKPMLDVLLGAEVKNICVVVTRYFGGTLLGTGGLVRAYSGAVQEGLKNSVIVEKCPGVELKIHTDYNGIGKIQYITAQMEIPVLDTQYTDAVDVVCMVPLEKEGSLVAQITEKTGGKAVMTRGKECYYGFADGELVLF